MGHGDPAPDGANQGGAGYPYPPQPQAGGVTAPGGYPVYNPAAAAAAAAAGSSAAAQPGGYPSAIPEPHKPQQGYGAPPPGAPGAYPPHHQQPPPPSGYPGGAYPPHQQAGGPAAGYPVMGTPAGAAPVGGMAVEGAGGPPPGQEKCGCTIGWVLFAIGFIFWPCWVAAAFVPLCTRSRSDRLAGIASTAAMLVLVVIAIIIGASSPKWRSSYAY